MAVATCLTRNVTHSINPGCSPSLCNNSDVDHVVNLVHLKAAGSEDSIHALWSTVGAPSALIARTEKDVNLTIDWERFVGVSYGQGSTVDPIVRFSSAPSVVFGFILRRLVEYDDKDDVADPDHYRRNLGLWTLIERRRYYCPLSRPVPNRRDLRERV